LDTNWDSTVLSSAPGWLNERRSAVNPSLLGACCSVWLGIRLVAGLLDAESIPMLCRICVNPSCPPPPLPKSGLGELLWEADSTGVLLVEASTGEEAVLKTFAGIP
jgi:hypothetical protein